MKKEESAERVDRDADRREAERRAREREAIEEMASLPPADDKPKASKEGEGE